ncbi:MAG: AAA family ATPase [Myxococcales bacterium]
MTRGKAKASWSLKSLTLRKLRGVADEHRFQPDGRPALVHGPNGVGKSTLALGLQWTLYGELPSGILPKAGLDKVLAPVTLKGKQSEGEAVFVRGKETCVVRRSRRIPNRGRRRDLRRRLRRR